MRNKTVFGLLLLLVAYLSGLIDGSSTEDQACHSIMPDHNATAQMSPAPFYILIDDDCSINDDDNGKKASHSNQTSAVNVTLISDNGKLPFEGFFIEAFSTNNSNVLIGSFQLISNSSNNSYKLIDCGGTNNAVTHADKQPKLNQTVLWIPDANFSGDVFFLGTVVVNYTTFWVGVQSLPITIVSPPASHQSNSTNGPLIYP